MTHRRQCVTPKCAFFNILFLVFVNSFGFNAIKFFVHDFSIRLNMDISTENIVLLLHT